MHGMTVSLALNGAGRGAMCGEQQAREMLTEAGFTHLANGSSCASRSRSARLPASPLEQSALLSVS